MSEEAIENVNGLYINSVYFAQFSDINTKNELSYASSPSRDTSFALDNISTEHAYIPSISLKLGYLTRSQYSSLIQEINTPYFMCEYYDIDLGKNVTRKMYCTSYSLGTLHHKGVNLCGLAGTTLEFVCYNGYASYDDLKNDRTISGD